MLFFFFLCFLFFFNDTATTEIYTLSLHDALPILLVKLDMENSQIVNEEIILRGCKMYKKPCHGDNTVGRIRDIEVDKKGRIYIITDEPESALWRISK